MAGDPSQVDWNYQLANIPLTFPPGGPAGGDLSGTYPDPTVAGLQGRPVDPSTPSVGDVLIWSGSVWAPGPGGSGGITLNQTGPAAGPFTGAALTVDHSRGLLASSGPTLSIELASRTQAGVIGTAGGQQLKGPFYATPAASSGSPPSWNSLAFPIVFQNGGIAFYKDSDGALASPHDSLVYSGIANYTGLTLTSGSSIFIQGGFNAHANVGLYNASVASNVTLYDDGTGIDLGDPGRINLRVYTGHNINVTLTRTGSPSNSGMLDLNDQLGNSPFYAVNGTKGAYGTMLDGSTVLGGIISVIGSTHVGGPPTGAAGGDLAGTYPNPTIGKLQGITLIATGGSSGDVMTYSGGQWKPLPIGTQTSLTQGGGQIAVDGSGDCIINPNPTHNLAFFGGIGTGQGTAVGTTAGFTANSTGNAVDSHSTFDGGGGGSVYTIGDLVRIFKGYGLLTA